MLNPANIGPNEEQYEYFQTYRRGVRHCQYDYRDFDGTLFSCVKPTLADCVTARDAWLASRAEV